MTTTQIGIIGMGPRGLTVLDRIVANERVHPSAGDLQIFIFDPHPPGVGCHDPDQEEHLLVNTVAGQITQFSDASVRDAGPILEGPSFHQWLDTQRSAMPTHRWPASPISADAYYSRALFGRYLHWVYHYLVALAPSHVQIFHVQDTVLSADRADDGSWVLGTRLHRHAVQYLFLTSGHTKAATPTAPGQAQHTATRVVDDPYPIRTHTADITSTMTVAIEGMGLTMFDMVAALTTGRGGRFVQDSHGQTRYLASGREPRLVAYSRSGLPLTARARNQKGISIQYRARFLLADTLAELRKSRQLDFHADVWPLLWADMQYAYYEAYLRAHRDPVATMLFTSQFVCTDAAGRQALIDHHVPAPDQLSWDHLVNPLPAEALATPETFHQWLIAHLHADLAEARKGNLDGPLKAACDVLRDLRDNLRAAIDHGGLTEASHRWLLSDFVPVMNRLAVGPPASRIAELLALIEAGVLDISHGPGARYTLTPPHERLQLTSGRWPGRQTAVDVLVRARVAMHSPADDASPLLRGLLKDGHLRLFHNGSFHPGGVDVNRVFNWVDAYGNAVENAWALGIPTEGAKFYTFVVPRSGVNSTAIVDAGRAVTQMLALIHHHTAAAGSPPSAASATPTAREVPSAEYASASASVFASLYGALF